MEFWKMLLSIKRAPLREFCSIVASRFKTNHIHIIWIPNSLYTLGRRDKNWIVGEKVDGIY
jgi:hypothetical protein